MCLKTSVVSEVEYMEDGKEGKKKSSRREEFFTGDRVYLISYHNPTRIDTNYGYIPYGY